MGFRVDKVTVTATVYIEFEGSHTFTFDVDPESSLATELMNEHERQLKVLLASSNTAQSEIFLG